MIQKPYCLQLSEEHQHSRYKEACDNIKAKIVAHTILESKTWEFIKSSTESSLWDGRPMGFEVRNQKTELVTFELEYPRFIHAQMMTYRKDVARNCASSRAIPFERNVQNIIDSPAIPLYFGSNQRGMKDKGPEGVDQDVAFCEWDYAIRGAVVHADRIERKGVHKQICNRPLEPFQNIKSIFTFDVKTFKKYFIAQRLHHDSQPEIQALAYKMAVALEESNPKGSSYHLPYIDSFSDDPVYHNNLENCLKASSVAAAQISYRKQDFGLETVNRVHKFLIEQGHGSPFDHIAFAPDKVIYTHENGVFRNLRTYRHELGI